jgi:hypothetical protein
MDKPSIFVDFQNCDPMGRARMTTVGTLQDLKRLEIELKAGLKVHLYDMELEAEGIVEHSKEENIWVAVFSVDDLKERQSGAK